MKNGYITVIDRHFTDEEGSEPQCGELRTKCSIDYSDGTIKISYKESVEAPQDCSTTLFIKGSRITMMRNGRFRTSMIFENGKRHICCYETPFGELMIGIFTNAMFVDMDENGGVMNFAYTIDNSGELISENELKITITEC